jgi:hypothetical protein
MTDIDWFISRQKPEMRARNDFSQTLRGRAVLDESEILQITVMHPLNCSVFPRQNHGCPGSASREKIMGADETKAV